jgi:ABC-2 type transport system ATP-binding protein
MACALLHQPKLLLIDEATSSLDPAARRQVWRVIEEETMRGAAVLMSTHHLEEAEGCGRVLWLHEGRSAGIRPYKDLAKKLDDFFDNTEVVA